MTFQEDAPLQRLDTIHFNATKTCNLSCAFCYDSAVRGKTKNLPLSVINNLIADAAELGARRVILSGGEPLSRNDWRSIAKAFDNAGMEVSLATNATLIDSDVVQFLTTLQNVTISLSLDGGKDVHDRLRGQEGAFERTIGGMHALNEHGLKFDINTTLSKLNISEVPTLTRIARDFSCSLRFTLLHPNGRGHELDTEALEPDSILEIREYCHVIQNNYGADIYVNLPPLLQYLDEITPSRGISCGWAAHFCGILANGDVSICGVASDQPTLIAGNILESSFKGIWLNSSLFKYTRSLKIENLRGVCGRCPFKQLCGGACRLSAFKQYGDMLSPYGVCQSFYELGYIPDELLEPTWSNALTR